MTSRLISRGCVALCIVLWCTEPKGLVRAQGPDLGTEAQRESGKALYLKYCSQCHGVDGKGGHDNAPAVTSIRNQQQVLYMIMSGRNSMPAIGNAMKPDEVRDVTEFVTRTLFVEPR